MNMLKTNFVMIKCYLLLTMIKLVFKTKLNQNLQLMYLIIKYYILGETTLIENN
jgi:hypothetical protein